MDKTAIRNFAIEARKILMKSAITEAGFYGITKDGCKDPVQKGNDFEVYETVAGTENRIFGDDIKRRANLVQAIITLGFEQVIEETAYTWFNRIIAIRFMEVNNYLPTRVRVLSSETGSGTPDIITHADTVELNLTSDELEKIQTAKRENRYDDAFRMLFIKQCNELNAILPGLFEKTDDYMELLLKITYTGDGVIRMLVDSIPEDNFNVETEGQVEIIGWMYQYYNTELKDDTFAKLKKNVKITKERIPAATQLFTPDWIVRYMVENSLGRVWIEHLRAVNPSVDEKAKAEEFGWKYYLPEAEQEGDVQAQLVEIRKSYKDLTPQDITCIDPCMGSGHILVYMFDVLMDIYRSEGFSEREAVFDILEKNIRGLDIDRRAYQLSYFALMMKARGYNRIFFRGHEDEEGNRIQAIPKVYAIEESNSIECDQLKYYGADLDEMQKNNAINQLNGLLDTLHDAKEYGSILCIDNYDWNLLRRFIDKVDNGGQISLMGFVAGQSQAVLKKLIDIGETLAKSYDAVVTNPPYMNSGSMGEKLTEFVKKNYENSKYDLFAVFTERCLKYVSDNGYVGIITQQGWMYLSTYEKLRNIILGHTFMNLIQLGAHAFSEIGGEVVQTAAYTIYKNTIPRYLARYYGLTQFGSEESKRQAFLEHKNEFISMQERFGDVPGKPIAFWVNDSFINNFKNPTLGEVAKPRSGLSTNDNARFLRLWFEVDYNKFYADCPNIEKAKELSYKWYPYNKGGQSIKWYGNFDYVVNWENDGEEIKYFATHNPKDPKTKHWSRRASNYQLYFQRSITWSLTNGGSFAARIRPQGSVFDMNGMSLFCNKDIEMYILALMCTKPVDYYMSVFNPTLANQAGDIAKIPFILDGDRKETVDNIAADCVNIAKTDWDSFETSWEFKTHPLIPGSIDNMLLTKNRENFLLTDCFEGWKELCNDRISRLKINEEELNDIFIDIYGLNDVLESKDIADEVTIHSADLGRDIRSLISYAVGCMFGRYSLNIPGLVYAGGEFDSNLYADFSVDADAVIPITDESYFNDDIVERFILFIEKVYGHNTLERNLDFVADALGTKGSSSREKIRNYFLNEFYKDHCNNYSKRPIYWLFDSGKQNGFKCLIYIHRYNPDTVGLIRSDYLTKTQSMIENALENAEYAINSSSSAVDRAQATKKRDKYIKQLAEIRAYYPALSHIALQRINLDLDDGVKVNYEKFQGIEVSIEGEKKQAVNLLAKI